jgi:hypothetical protein
MEEDLKIFKVEYLSNHLSDHTQILSLILNDQIIFLQIFKMKTTSNGRQPQILKVEYISNHSKQILKFEI